MEIQKKISGIFHTGRNCIKCGRKELRHEINYAGLNINKEDFAFPDRIKRIVIPGPKFKFFLCEKCVNLEYKIECKIHGKIIGNRYSYGHAPKCPLCEKQLKAINNKSLPDGFLFIVPLTYMLDKDNKTVDGAILCLSEDNTLYIISKKILIADHFENLSFKISHSYNSLSFIIEPKSNSSFKSCNITISNERVPLGKGPWIELWKPEFINILAIETASDVYCLTSINHKGVKSKEFKHYNNKFSPCICAIANGQIKTFPNIDLMSLDQIRAWEVSTGLNKKILIIFEKDNLPEQLSIKNFPGIDGFQTLDQLIRALPAPSDKIQNYSIDYKGLFGLVFSTDEQKVNTLLEIDTSTIKATTIPDGTKALFTYYYSYNQTCLLLSKDYKIYARGSFSNKSIQIISASISRVEKLLTDNISKYGIFITKNHHQKTIILRLFDNGFTIDKNQIVNYANIKNIDLIKVEDDCFELTIQFLNNIGENTSLNVIAPERYAYDTLETFEVYKVKNTSLTLSLLELYNSYNDLKKYNLLTGLFSDIIIMIRELDNEIPINELHQKLEYMTSNQLFNEKKLYGITQKKLLLLNMFLPKIKQNFEYLSSYYPYYQLENEINLISGAFGKNIAKRMLNNERKRIVISSRNNVRAVQTKFQIIFSEIERVVSPIGQLFSREEVNKNLFSKVTKYFPHGAQGVLLGTLLATGAGSGMGIIAGMLGIRTLHDILNYFKSDRETAGQIKKVFGTVAPWWQLLKDTLPVASYESAEAINEDITYCMQRDHEIYKQFPEKQRIEINKKLKFELQKKINGGTKNQFAEILVGSGIRFKALTSDLETAINKEMPQSIRKITSTFTIQQPNPDKQESRIIPTA